MEPISLDTEIVELPAILDEQGQISIMSLDLQRLTDNQRWDIARLMNGRVAWVKMRATYTALETNLCTNKDCYNPVKNQNSRCERHDK